MNTKIVAAINLASVSMIAMLLLTGCATTAPTADFSNGMAFKSRVATNDEVKTRVAAESGVNILEEEKTRLAEKIQERVSAKKIMNSAGTEKKSYEIELTLSRYDKGSAFARAMLAGLGQIHIDGVVRLYEFPDRKEVCEFAIKKTFAWGGIYGAATSMEDIERTFADGIASTLTGQKEDPPKDKNG
jgi:hypothetical protein